VTSTSTTLHVLNVNGAPVFDALDGWTVVEGQAIGSVPSPTIRTIRATCRRPHFAGVLTLWRVRIERPVSIEDLPPGASFDPVTQMFTWVPDFTQAVSTALTSALRTMATHRRGGHDAVTVAITVSNQNRARFWTHRQHQREPRREHRRSLAVSDPTAIAHAQRGGMPRFAQIVTMAEGTRVLRVTPGDQDRATTSSRSRDRRRRRRRCARATERQQQFVVTANSPNEPPCWSSSATKCGIRADTQLHDPRERPRPGSLTLATMHCRRVRRSPRCDLRTAEFGDAGRYAGRKLRSHVHGCRQRNMAPALSAATSRPSGSLHGKQCGTDSAARRNQALAEGDTYQLQLQALDADGDPLTYTVKNPPPGFEVDAHTGR